MKRMISTFLVMGIYTAFASSGFLPNPPFASIGEVISFITSNEFIQLLLQDCTSTVSLTLLSWFIGSILGVFCGILIALSGKRAGIIIGMLEFLRSIPAAMWIPFGIVLVGIGTKSALWVSTFVVFLFMASEAAYSEHLFLQIRHKHLKRLGVNLWDRIFKAHIYEVLTVAIPSSKIAITISLIVVVVGEMQGGSSIGLGSRLIIFQASQRGEAMISLMMLAGIVGTLLNVILDVVENLIVPWHRKDHQ